MTDIATKSWDPVEHFESNEDIVAYLYAVLEDGAPSVFVAALGDVARVRSMTNVARSAGLGRESLDRALSPSGNPDFVTVLKVLDALGLRLSVEPESIQT